MSDLSLISHKFDVTTENLINFNKSLDILKRQNNILDDPKYTKQILKILEPLSNILNGSSSNRLTIDVKSIIEILHQQHNDDWDSFIRQIKQLVQKLQNPSEIKLNEYELCHLDNVANALDAECAHLFRKISSRL